MGQSARTKMVSVFVIAAVFAAGLAVGLAVDANALAAPTSLSADSLEADSTARRQPLYEQVGPSADQKVRIDSIVLEYREKVRTLRSESRREYEMHLDAVADTSRQAIKKVFTPEQAAQYDSLVADYDRRLAEKRANREDY